MTFLAELLISALLVLGGVFGLVGSYGLIKLQDSMQRLHAPTKATTLGVGGVLIASILYFTIFKGATTISEVLIMLFLFLTAPVTANFIAKAYMHRNVAEDELPPSESAFGWAGYNPPPDGGAKGVTKTRSAK